MNFGLTDFVHQTLVLHPSLYRTHRPERVFRHTHPPDPYAASLQQVSQPRLRLYPEVTGRSSHHSSDGGLYRQYFVPNHIPTLLTWYRLAPP